MDWFLYDIGLRHERVKKDSDTSGFLYILQYFEEHLFL